MLYSFRLTISNFKSKNTPKYPPYISNMAFPSGPNYPLDTIGIEPMAYEEKLAYKAVNLAYEF